MAASCSYSNFAGNKDAFIAYSIPKENESLKALNAMLTETQRMKQYGFTQGEMERIKANLIRTYETAYNERNNRKNDELIYPVLVNFLENEPNPGIEYEYNFMKNEIPGVSLDEINKVAAEFISENNIIVTVTGPEKDGLTMPTVDEIRNVLTVGLSAKVDPYVDKLANQKLVENEPVAGNVVKESKNSVFGTTEWTLSNGMKVVFKQTDFKAEEVVMRGFSMGGISQVKDEDVVAGSLLSSMLPEMGIGNFSPTELRKMLSGKRVAVYPGLSSDREEISGNFSIKDIETQLQLVYLAFTNPRWNDQEFNTWFERTKESYKNMDSDPRKALGDTISLMMTDHHKRGKLLNYAEVSSLNLEKFKQVYADRFCDPGNFVFIFTGTINPEEVKPLFEKYLASLPTIRRNEAFRDNGVRVPKGKAVNDFKHESTTPRTTVYINYNFKCKYTPEEMLLIGIMGHILELRYTEAIREDKGGAYSIYAGGTPKLYPFPMCNLQVYFETDPLKADDLIQTVNKEIKKIIEEGPDKADLQKAKEFFLKSRPENLKENSWWNSVISDYYYSNIDTYSGYEKMVNHLNAKQLKKYFKSHLSNPDICQVVMRPL
jgi:zinc protease